MSHLYSVLYRPHQENITKLGAYCTAATPLQCPCATKPQEDSKQLYHEILTPNPENYVDVISESHHVVINNYGFSVLDNISIELFRMLFYRPISYGDAFITTRHFEKGMVRSLIADLKRAGILLSDTIKPAVGAPPRRCLTAWVAMTEQCNLSCSYCFKSKNMQSMDENTAKSIAQQIFNTAGKHHYQHVELTYAGGEPLMQLHRLLDLHQYASGLAKNVGVDFTGHIVTNGVLLTSKIITQLKDEKIQVMISLDGISHHSNKERHDLMGRSTTHKVMQNIQQCIKAELDPLVSITMTPQSVHGLSAMTEWLIDIGARFSFNLQQHPQNSSVHLQTLDEKDVIHSMTDAFSVVKARLSEITMPLSSLLDQGDLVQPHQIACSAGKDHLVFDSQGALYACPMQPTPLQQHPTGDLIDIIHEKSDSGLRLSVENKEGCQNCEWKHWCAGGCPVNTYQQTGRFDIKSPWCKVYKAIFPQVLRLEGMRILTSM